MNRSNIIRLGNKFIGDGQPVYIIAEIGINHNGSLENAKKLIDGAVFAGCDAVKFQKRTPEICVPEDQWYIERDTPWGRMTYLEYRHKVEFGFSEYEIIDQYCREKNIHWFASAWDVEAVKFLEDFNIPMYKISSASLTDEDLLKKVKATDKPIMISTGMSSLAEIDKAVEILTDTKLMIAQSTSNYPCNLNELNINVIENYKNRFPKIPIGYSGHETGLAPTYAAVAKGATFVERHITLDRASWGSDQAASVEIMGLYRLVKDIRDIELALGDGIKRVYDSEKKSMAKLRKNISESLYA
ncbi:MAG: N-acetylneuraminate synthase family protein [Ignavibacteriae bacterium]|nr:N-acetylneuraminate synthase family protein [Ignavibacteriota bacterium]